MPLHISACEFRSQFFCKEPVRVGSRRSPNSACTMEFWRIQGLVKVTRTCAVPGHAESLNKHKLLSFVFQKKWCWRSSVEFHLFIFRRMLGLICCFCCKTKCDPATPPPASLGVQGISEGFPRCPKGSKVMKKWYQNYPKVIQQWPHSDPKVMSNWHACMTCMHDMHAWNACMTCMHDMHAWHACMTCVHAWHACMACIHDMHAWHACMTCMYDMHAYHAWLKVSSRGQWGVICGSFWQHRLIIRGTHAWVEVRRSCKHA